MTQPRVFLDCGSNLGQGFEHFRNQFGTTNITYELFEPNPRCFSILQSKYAELHYVKLHNCAVSTQDGQTSFYFNTEFDVGGTIIKDHNSQYYNTQTCSKQVYVRLVNLIHIIDQLHEARAQIYIKLDIESAEYDILSTLMHTGNFHKVSHMWCEFHSQYMKDPERMMYQQLELEILNYVSEHQINFHLWH
jgi:FkbM family methyltransferase